ncbi:type I-F CRISPR-associated helicase Cas3f [Salinisphaera sp. G21_0]|uniref:type I-F CRISPR-associated helicase Cas3f n=1 Tax=Salinisphaera sp. G21_0 TaxID=2821094 RepID=UPI001ADB26CC|nr:type I-F CRISPR-associated helicase Cas3f [Salinisphaera sp. G21_0]MBO9481229.1 type I-F CRISPR-associated helicase Cas3 [Salinisphaera sp. G21_0]
MMVTFISQCEKNALKKTRRVLDAFADRIGDNTWQTIITQDGLNAVKKLLRKTATKSTAVSCHWLRSRSRSELVWVVGKRNAFSNKGLVPVNQTRRTLIGTEWENSWAMATSIQIVAVLAALLHDLGKATVGFQRKLKESGNQQSDPYRHEWLSLRLFEALISGCSTDKEWLARLCNLPVYFKQHPNWVDSLYNDYAHKNRSKGIAHLPPLAQLVAWLTVTHHRLPCDDRHNFREREKLRHQSKFLGLDIARFYKRLSAYNYWVFSEKAQNERNDVGDFWRFSAQATDSLVWQKTVKRWATKALNHPPLLNLPETNNPLLMHLARLCLMVGDHNYSSLPADDQRRVTGDQSLTTSLIANTDRQSKQPKQALDEHLLGVARFTGDFARLLPRFAHELPYLEDISPFSKRTSTPRFQWQNQSWNLVKKHQKEARQQGFFGVNLASTGCGKTLGNARIMAALADPERGPRFTIALGLRVLTLQTGIALRERLNLDDTELAILVGGAAQRTLFDLQQQAAEESSEDNGSESASDLIIDKLDYENCVLDKSTLGTIIQDPKASDLLYAPVVSCTVDHIISATETLRGGRHIVPILRLLTSDLILDEPDDFDQNDLPALSRLVHMAGMMGSNVLLSSATLTPDLVQGLYVAYQKGRQLWQLNQNGKSTGVYCAWFDEFHQHIEPCSNEQTFAERHTQFTRKRIKALNALPPKRVGEILPTALPRATEEEKIHNRTLAQIITDACTRLHNNYHETCPASDRTASVGLIRMANIDPMVDLARALYQSPLPKNIQLHICCYHARQLLFLRSRLEHKLDRILNRNNGKNLFDHPEITNAVHSGDKKHHIFIVLATAVAEVGRDHDYDWAIIEPSSMRSIIQLVGRVWRHRPDKVVTEANVLILDSNIKALQAGSTLGVGVPVFLRPGFESNNHLLNSHRCSDDLITDQQLANINSIPRIARPAHLQPTQRLADLEHAVMADLLNATGTNVVNAFWQNNSAAQANTHMQRATPFRYDPIPQVDVVAVPDEDSCSGIRFRYAEKAWENPLGQDSINSKFAYQEFVPESTTSQPWLVSDYHTALDDLCAQLGNESSLKTAIRFASIRLAKERSWCFHPWFGFWPS